MTWRKVTCQEREALVDARGRSYGGFSAESGIGVLSALTDLDGQYGEPKVFTEWGERDTDTPVLRDVRWPARQHHNEPHQPDAKPCEHYVWDSSTVPDHLPDNDESRGHESVR